MLITPIRLQWQRPDSVPHLLTLLAGICAAAYSAWTVLDAADPVFDTPPGLHSAAPSGSTLGVLRAPERTALRLADFVGVPLFGQWQEHAVAQVALERTPLQLELRAIFAHDTPGTAYAVISDARGETHRYAGGQPVPGDARIHEIAFDHVVLEHNGQFELLGFPSMEHVKEQRATPSPHADRATAPAHLAPKVPPHAAPRDRNDTPSGDDTAIRLQLSARMTQFQRHNTDTH